MSGTWQCPYSALDSCSTPSTAYCPPPSNVNPGWECTPNGLQCPGDGTICDGQVFYNTLLCQQSSWSLLVAATCNEAIGIPIFDGGVLNPVDGGIVSITPVQTP